MPLRSHLNERRALPRWLLGVWAMIILGAWLLQASVSPSVDGFLGWKIVALDWGPWLAVIPFVIWLCGRWPIDPRTWRWAVPMHIVLSIVVSTSLGALVWRGWLHNRATPMGERGSPPPFGGPALGPGKDEFFGDRDSRPPPSPVPLFLLLTFGRGSIFFYWALLAVTHAVVYHRRSVLRERQALTAEAHLAEARLIALQAQLQPHFLFNTLNAISSMVYDNPVAADAMICSLSELLRRVLAASAKREVSLEEELALARSYVAIQKVRFGETLQVRWETPDEWGGAAVPTLLLQPLIENAVIHAVEEQNGRGGILVRAERQGEFLVLTVQDSGASRESETKRGDLGRGLGMGLSNTKGRLQELYPDEHEFEFQIEPGRGAQVLVKIPYRPLLACDENPDRR